MLLFLIALLSRSGSAAFVQHEANGPKEALIPRKPELIRRRFGGELIRSLNFTLANFGHDVSLVAAETPVLGGPLPVPDKFSWADREGLNYLASTYNQHIPQ